LKVDKSILLRTHADADTGFGHLIRICTLGESLANRGLNVRMALGGDEAAFARAREVGCNPEKIVDFDPSEANVADKPDAVLVDSYLYGDDYLAAWRAAGVKVVIVDDLADRGLVADFVINPNVVANEYRKIYKDLDCGRLLLGPHYAIIRPEIVAELETASVEPPRVLIIFGASDIGGNTAVAVRALSKADSSFALDVVVGPDAPTLADIEQAVNEALEAGRETVLHIAPHNLPRLMAEATMAVSAGGVTAAELACLGRPAVLLSVADNQTLAAQRWQDLSIHRMTATPLDPLQLRAEVDLMMRSINMRELMGVTGRRLIDGKGATRVANELAQWLGEQS